MLGNISQKRINKKKLFIIMLKAFVTAILLTDIKDTDNTSKNQ